MSYKDRNDAHECQECGAIFNTILEPWTTPKNCYECGAEHPWERVK